VLSRAKSAIIAPYFISLILNSIAVQRTGVVAMSSADVKALLEKEFPGAQVTFEEGYHNQIEVVSDMFEGM